VKTPRSAAADRDLSHHFRKSGTLIRKSSFHFREWKSLDREWKSLDREWKSLDREWNPLDRRWNPLDREWKSLDWRWKSLGRKSSFHSGKSDAESRDCIVEVLGAKKNPRSKLRGLVGSSVLRDQYFPTA
jgi:hypothetical protein